MEYNLETGRGEGEVGAWDQGQRTDKSRGVGGWSMGRTAGAGLQLL